jgi:hypothetical protein
VSGTQWVDVVHSETGGRARINADAWPAHKALGWVLDDNPHADAIDPTDPVATSTPVQEPFVDDLVDLEEPVLLAADDENATPITEPRDATPATDTKRS